jgi:hypothetical protein
MTIAFALEYICRKMCNCEYSLNFRHLVLQPKETRSFPAHNQSALLIEPSCDVRVESDTGIYDLSEDLANELQYEHSGDILITNYSMFLNHIRFIQVIPKNCKTPCQ